MTRKSKFPCGKHYEVLSVPKEMQKHWTQEELNSMYDPKCDQCRWTYKWSENNALFRLKWWHRTARFNAWIFGMGHYPLVKHAIWTYKNKGMWALIKVLFWNRYNYDQYQILDIPFLSVYWAPLEMSDIREGYIDMSRYSPEKTMSDIEDKEYNAKTQYLIKVALRFQKMWETGLKEKRWDIQYL